MIPPCLTLSNIRYISRVKWSNLGKGVMPSPTPRCSRYWKWSLLVALDYSRQLYFLTFVKNQQELIHGPNIYIYIYIFKSEHMSICMWLYIHVCIIVYVIECVCIFIYVSVYKTTYLCVCRFQKISFCISRENVCVQPVISDPLFSLVTC